MRLLRMAVALSLGIPAEHPSLHKAFLRAPRQNQLLGTWSAFSSIALCTWYVCSKKVSFQETAR